MGNKVDIAEVKNFSDDLQKASSEIQSSLDDVKKKIEAIDSMNSFSGQAAKEAKHYFNDLHQTILGSFQGLFEDLDDDVKRHLKSFSSNVDSSEEAVIKNGYLDNVKEDMNETYGKLKEDDEAISEIIKSVSDITSATILSFTDISNCKQNAGKSIKGLAGNFQLFTDKGVQSNVEDVLHQIEAMMEQIKTSKGSDRFIDYKHGSKNVLAKLKDYNEEKKENQLKKEKEDLKEITSKMNGKDEEKDGVQENEKLKQYINEDVLTSKSALNEEIERVSGYLQKEESKNGGYVENDSFHVKLLSYMHILNNYKKDINYVNENLPYGDVGEDDTLLARVESFKSGFTGANSEKKAYRYIADSGITVNYYQGGEAMTDRDEFLNKSWPDDKELAFHNKSHTEYFRREAAPKQLEYMEDLKDQKTVDVANGQAVVSAIFSMATGTATGLASSFAGKQADADDASQRIDLSDLEDASEDFDLDIMLNHRDVPGHSAKTDKELYPTKHSAGVIERWQEHEDFPTKELYDKDIKDKLRKNDWVGLIHTLKKNGAELDDKEKDQVYRYIKGYKDD